MRLIGAIVLTTILSLLAIPVHAKGKGGLKVKPSTSQSKYAGAGESKKNPAKLRFYSGEKCEGNTPEFQLNIKDDNCKKMPNMFMKVVDSGFPGK
jgi:hypothetical protein